MNFNCNDIHAAFLQEVLTKFYAMNYSDVKENFTLTSPLWNGTYESTNSTTVESDEETIGFIVRNVKLLKALVLCVVVLILILTMVKFVFKAFSSSIDERKDG
jgi:hypothetical protein